MRSERGKRLSVQGAIEPDGNVDGTMRHGMAVERRKKKKQIGHQGVDASDSRRKLAAAAAALRSTVTARKGREKLT